MMDAEPCRHTPSLMLAALAADSSVTGRATGRLLQSVALATVLVSMTGLANGAGEPKQLSCENGATHDAGYGMLTNNQWNKEHAGPGPWQQCLLSRERAGRTEYGWSWQWPSRNGLYAYPEVLTGRSPWAAIPSNDERFPRRIADTKALWIDYDIESSYRGERNLSSDFWLTDAPAPPALADAHSIRAELMIWTDASDAMISPQDKPTATVEIDGRAWTLYVLPDRGGDLPGVTRQWTLISYHATSPALAIRYDVRKFLRDAVDRGLLQDSDFINGFELGNEIVSGSGSTWIRRLEIEVD